ncbi:MAG TPA: 2Fe-2S iron-sulfur cluster-binding protein [Polyangiaceae bacterium]|nr:2Fe-2S iron-sulfur cluster-binding protein [Polyangiaceae bacterium]
MAIGQVAPPLGMRYVHGREVVPASFAGQTVLLAFFDACACRAAVARNDRALQGLRAQLRGLGAALIIFSDDGLWCFRPDDDWELCVGREELDAAGLHALRASYGVKDDVPAFFLVDGQWKLRFAGQLPAREAPSLEALVSALSDVGRAILNAPRTSHDETDVANVARGGARERGLSRRELVLSGLMTVFAFSLLEACRGTGTGTASDAGAASVGNAGTSAAEASPELDVTLNVNGENHTLHIEPRVSLLDALRERMSLTGTKKGCDHGQCGACTVLVDGRRVHACLTLAVMAQGAKIATIEGLARGDELHPMQAAFVSHDGLQCGYCTPGQIMSAVGLLHEGHAKTDDEVREEMSGNICRCGAYSNIVAAIQLARKGIAS